MHCQRPNKSGFPSGSLLLTGLLVLCVWGILNNPAYVNAAPLYEKTIMAGDPDFTPTDSPGNRVDPNVTTSLFGGVGSILVGPWDSNYYLGSGTAISPTQVLTAAHLLDLDDNGSIDVAPGNVQFHLNYNGDNSSVITASSLSIYPDFTGFSNPYLNDDIAIITLSSALPDGVPIYDILRNPLQEGEMLTMVGYGRSGNGVDGYTTGASLDIKRVGSNTADIFLEDDEGSGVNEVFAFDFDFPDTSYPGYESNLDLGGTSLGNDLETQLGGGDSGGPSFVFVDGELIVAGINTFVGSLTGGPAYPYFGSIGGGTLVPAYADWIDSIIAPVPIPGAVWLLGSGLIGLVGLGRKRQ